MRQGGTKWQVTRVVGRLVDIMNSSTPESALEFLAWMNPDAEESARITLVRNGDYLALAVAFESRDGIPKPSFEVR